jgi:hypothetical protein
LVFNVHCLWHSDLSGRIYHWKCTKSHYRLYISATNGEQPILDTDWISTSGGHPPIAGLDEIKAIAVSVEKANQDVFGPNLMSPRHYLIIIWKRLKRLVLFLCEIQNFEVDKWKEIIWHLSLIRKTYSFTRVAPTRQQQDLLLRTPFVPESAT